MNDKNKFSFNDKLGAIKSIEQANNLRDPSATKQIAHYNGLWMYKTNINWSSCNQ